eukprot:s4514_g4.t2
MPQRMHMALQECIPEEFHCANLFVMTNLPSTSAPFQELRELHAAECGPGRFHSLNSTAPSPEQIQRFLGSQAAEGSGLVSASEPSPPSTWRRLHGLLLDMAIGSKANYFLGYGGGRLGGHAASGSAVVAVAVYLSSLLLVMVVMVTMLATVMMLVVLLLLLVLEAVLDETDIGPRLLVQRLGSRLRLHLGPAAPCTGWRQELGELPLKYRGYGCLGAPLAAYLRLVLDNSTLIAEAVKKSTGRSAHPPTCTASCVHVPVRWFVALPLPPLPSSSTWRPFFDITPEGNGQKSESWREAQVLSVRSELSNGRSKGILLEFGFDEAKGTNEWTARQVEVEGMASATFPEPIKGDANPSMVFGTPTDEAMGKTTQVTGVAITQRQGSCKRRCCIGTGITLALLAALGIGIAVGFFIFGDKDDDAVEALA